MLPPRKSKSESKRFSNLIDVSPNKDDGSLKSRTKRMKKLLDMLGPQWSKEELERFYESYRKYGKDWRRVAAALCNRSTEMVEALYNMNRAYLSLPDGMTSIGGFVAMMMDHYNVLIKMSRKKLAISRKGPRFVPGITNDSRKVTQTMEPDQVERFNQLSTKRFIPNIYIDWDVLRKYGFDAEIQRLLSLRGWDRLFSTREKVYKQLTLEFLATFSIERLQMNQGNNNAVVFKVNGQYRRLTMAEFSVYMGLYDEDYVQTKEFKDLPVSLPDGLMPAVFWRQLSTVANDPKVSKASAFQNPCHRVLHWLLSHTMRGRGKSSSVVSSLDLIYLHSLIKRRPIHLGVMLAFYIHHQATNEKVRSIGCGAYIMRLLKNIGLFPDRAPLDLICESVPLKETSLAKMSYVVVAEPFEGQTQQTQQPQAVLSQSSIVNLLSEILQLQKQQAYINMCVSAIACHLGIELPAMEESSSADEETPIKETTAVEVPPSSTGAVNGPAEAAAEEEDVTPKPSFSSHHYEFVPFERVYTRKSKRSS